MQLSDKMHSLIIKIFEQKRVERKKWLTLLWETRRLNHACCISPINETFVCKFNDARIWLQDLQESQLAFIGFQQSFSFNGETLSSNLGVDVPTVDEVIANLHEKDRHSTFVSAYIYLDLSRRFSSNGELAEVHLIFFCPSVSIIATKFCNHDQISTHSCHQYSVRTLREGR